MGKREGEPRCERDDQQAHQQYGHVGNHGVRRGLDRTPAHRAANTMFCSVPSWPTAKICSLMAPLVFWLTSSAKRSQIVWLGEIGVSMDASFSVVGSAPRALATTGRHRSARRTRIGACVESAQQASLYSIRGFPRGRRCDSSFQAVEGLNGIGTFLAIRCGVAQA